MRAREVDPEVEAWERRQWDPAAGDVIVFANLADLSTEKLEIVERTLRAILYSPVAEETFAQIVDGKPTRPSFFRNYGGREFMSNPNVSNLERPREEAIRVFHEIRANFSLLSLKIDVKIAQAYQSVAEQGLEHDLRLLDFAAASVNALGAMIFASFHPEVDFRPQRGFADFYGTNHFYVDFYHTGYQRFEKFPFGLLNVVGYWAETQIFGGVLLFNRGESGCEIEEAFVHPQGLQGYYRYQLSERQIARFASLSSKDQADRGSDALDALPFTQEPDAVILPEHVQAEPPIRIYKTEYDKPAPMIRKDRPRCVGTQEDLDELNRATREYFHSIGKPSPWEEGYVKPSGPIPSFDEIFGRPQGDSTAENGPAGETDVREPQHHL